MSSRLPDFVDPWRMADLGKAFSGRAALACLPRLGEAVLDAEGEIELQLAFERMPGRRAAITGFVRAALVLECQRCLSPMSVPIESRLNIALIRSAEEAERLPERYDPLLLDESRIRLLDIVEDELLLSLPQVARHEPGDCCADLERHAAPPADPDVPDDRPNPFAVLAALKQK